jgi:hypothetical protein
LHSFFLRRSGVPAALAIAASIVAALLRASPLLAQNPQAAPSAPAPIVRATAEPDPAAQATEPIPPPAKYDPAIFQTTLPPDQLSGLQQFAGAKSRQLMKDIRKMMKAAIPDCTFHYGRDMSLSDALDDVIEGSSIPIQLRDGRYLLVSGREGPYLSGRGFLWIDLQTGIALGGFYFAPTNGEPTPALNIFSRQVKETALSMGQLPPAFAQDLLQWTRDNRIQPLTTRYFLTGANKKILLEHDEDFCTPTDGSPTPPQQWCQQMNADAADLDLTAAYYVEQTRHATNATAWMISGDQVAFLRLRDSSCGIGPNPIGCRIFLTRQRVRVISRPSPGRPHR